MGWKCTPQVKGLVRGTPKKGAKHRANIRAILAELGEERISQSDTLDRSRSHLNVYDNFSSGFQCADIMTKQADNYRIQCTGKGKAQVERKLRADAVIGCAVIFNPPEEICSSWTDAQYEKFYKDSTDALKTVCPDIFRDENIRMTAEHFDEGTIADPSAISRHVHKVYDCIDTDGKYCGNLIDGKMLDTINHVYPAFMRSRGWDIDDLDCTDWDRSKSDKAYRDERTQKRKKSGKDVNDYLTGKLQEQLSNVTDIEIEYKAGKKKNEADAKENEERSKKLDDWYEELKAYHDSLIEARDKILLASKNADAREDALNAREATIQEKEREITERDKKSLKTANTLSSVAGEIVAKYKEAQTFYLQEQSWSGAEARRHIRERNQVAERRIRQVEEIQESVKSVPNDDYQY